MGCCGGNRDHIYIPYTGEECFTRAGGQCPIDGSQLKIRRRPKSHWRCKANGHAYAIC